jgi:hypothetical protein
MHKTDFKIISIEPETLERFKQSWSCHDIHPNVDHIVATFHDGDLIDYDLLDSDDNPLEYGLDGHDAGEALSALFDDALTNYRVVLDDPKIINQILEY